MTHAIKRLTLSNFQSHEHTEITPAPPGGLTVIVGPSGHGKTAILRALRWLLYNQPQGMGFMRKGAQVVQVVADLTSGAVTRRRTASTNQYITVTDEKGRQVFEGFAGAVPLEVQQLTGVREMQVADLTIAPNFAEQLDGPFLGERVTSAGTRAKVLGRIAGIDEVDLAAKNLSTDQFRRGQEEKRLEREVADLGAREAQYAHLPDLRRRIETLDTLLADLTRAEERRAAVTRMAERLRQIRAASQQAQTVMNQWAQVLPGAEANIARAEAAAVRQTHVATLAAQHRTVQIGQQAARATLTRTAGADQALVLLTSAAATLERRTRLTSLATSLRQAQANAAATQITLTRATGAAQATEPLTYVAGALERQTRLLRLQATRQGITHARNAAEAALARYDQAEQVITVATAAGDNLARVARLTKLQKNLGFTRILIGGARTVIQEEAAKAERAQREYVETLTAVGRCPVCGGEIDAEHLKEAV